MFLKTDKRMPPDAHRANPFERELQQLIDGDFQARWDATKQLTALGTEAIAYLIPLLQDEELDWEIRWFAARALGTFESDLALQALIDLLQHTQETELIAITAEGISRFGEKGVDALVPLLDHPIHGLAAVQALANIRHSSVFAPLLSATRSSNPSIRTLAISAIATFRNAEADAALLDALKDPIACVRREAIGSIGVRGYLLETTNLIDILLPGLWDINLDVCIATAIALGRLGTETAVATLARVLTSPHSPEPLRVSIVRALGWIEKESALGALFSSRGTVSTTVQVEIVQALSRIQRSDLRQRASDMLCHWLQDLTSQTTATAVLLKPEIALALGNLRAASARSLLSTLMHDSDAQTQLYAEAALRQLNASS